jgi:5-formyltetrahydrofolate cyclo-ligase
MPDALSERKSGLRRDLRARLAELSPEFRRDASARICGLLSHQPRWREARAILFFAPLTGEPDIWPLIQQGLSESKVVALPRFSQGEGTYCAAQVQFSDLELTRGRFGVREPGPGCLEIPLNQLDFVLVPGVAFDLTGRRLGRGRGFYDRLLTAVRGLTCGVAFDEQIVPAVPVEPHDIHLNCILTPTRWIEL